VIEEVPAFGGGEVVDERADPSPEGVDRAFGVFSQVRLELGERLLDRIEIGRIGRQVAEFAARRLDRLADGGALVGAEIVHHHDVAGRERGEQDFGDVGEKPFAVHRAVQRHRRGQPIDAQTGGEGRHLPVAVRDLALEPLAARAASARARHVGGAAGFIDEDELSGIEKRLPGPPGLARGRHVRAILLARQHAFF